MKKAASAKKPAPSLAKPKRLTIDISPELHTRIKLECTRRGENMADVIREILEREFP